MLTPTEKQIKLVENINRVLNLDFPTSSKEFNRFIYSNYIKCYIKEYLEVINDVLDEDDFYESCVNDVWCEHY
jgi:hypothetical protein